MPIRILPSGIVEVARPTERGTWRSTIAPGDVAEAQRVLEPDELVEVKKAWTEEVVTKWRNEHPEPPLRTEPRPPSASMRVAELEGALAEVGAAFLELASGKPIPPAKLDKIRARLERFPAPAIRQ